MPKSEFIDPNQVRQPGFIEFQAIPVNQYQKTVKDERSNFTDDEFKSMYHDMVLIREFETMINLIKTKVSITERPIIIPGLHIFPSVRNLQQSAWLGRLLSKISFLEVTVRMVKFLQKGCRQFINSMMSN